MKRYRVIATKQFRKDLRKLDRSGRDIEKLYSVVSVLTEGKILKRCYKDHPFKGHLKKQRVCHIAPDWLLMYERDANTLVLFLVSTGSHRHVLGIE